MYCHFNEKDDPNMIGLNPKLMSMLDRARALADIPFIIVSGVRTPEHNKLVGGVVNSAHLTGDGADLQCSDSCNRFIMIRALIIVGFKRIEICKGHIHIDIDETKDQNVIFLG
jgi:hypothetical protein